MKSNMDFIEISSLFQYRNVCFARTRANRLWQCCIMKYAFGILWILTDIRITRVTEIDKKLPFQEFLLSSPDYQPHFVPTMPRCPTLTLRKKQFRIPLAYTFLPLFPTETPKTLIQINSTKTCLSSIDPSFCRSPHI